ncbi:MAG: zinc ribbon domain-containing protein [Dehalococcoidia bacterium]|nr:MAG: zinc ribbon domain-containing protein [Dehalococcoidia bacterium]
MPIYEYRAVQSGCGHCSTGFDALQKMADRPLQACPKCGAPVCRVFSRFAACSTKTTDEARLLDGKLRDYEEKGMWSHAAELADKSALEERAMDDYRKAGYNF